MNIATIRQWDTKPQLAANWNFQELIANSLRDGVDDNHAICPLPFRDVILALSWSDVVF